MDFFERKKVNTKIQVHLFGIFKRQASNLLVVSTLVLFYYGGRRVWREPPLPRINVIDKG